MHATTMHGAAARKRGIRDIGRESARRAIRVVRFLLGCRHSAKERSRVAMDAATLESDMHRATSKLRNELLLRGKLDLASLHQPTSLT